MAEETSKQLLCKEAELYELKQTMKKLKHTIIQKENEVDLFEKKLSYYQGFTIEGGDLINYHFHVITYQKYKQHLFLLKNNTQKICLLNGYTITGDTIQFGFLHLQKPKLLCMRYKNKTCLYDETKSSREQKMMNYMKNYVKNHLSFITFD
jgi:hypothetical protein